MTLGDRIPDTARTIHRSKATTYYWIAFFGFCGSIVAFLLLQRLGLPAEIVVGAIIALTSTLFVWLSWISRTMTSYLFFYASRALGPFTSGLGSTSDFLSGALLILMFSTSLAGQMVLALSVTLGILLQAVVFSSAFQRSGVSSLPGFFAWRSQNQLTGYVALVAVFGILGALALAEFNIAQYMVQTLMGLPSDQTVWIVLVLAVLPSVFGGWSGLLLVNATIVIWMLISALIPAASAGFLAPLLASSLKLDFTGTPIEPLDLTATSLILETGISTHWVVLTVLTMAAGFSVLPQALSRISTNSRPVEAIESGGWLALMVFLMLSALPLSVGLIVASPTSSKLALLLQGQPVLQMLPYFIILFAALNGLAVTLFTAASSIVRASSRLRNLDPGEQSVFSTRLGVLLLAILVWLWPDQWTPDTTKLLVGGLMVGAGGLFVPLLLSTWVSALTSWALITSVAAGTAVTIAILTPLGDALSNQLVLAGVLGALTSLVILCVDQALAVLRKKHLTTNSSAQFLRHH